MGQWDNIFAVYLTVDPNVKFHEKIKKFIKQF